MRCARMLRPVAVRSLSTQRLSPAAHFKDPTFAEKLGVKADGARFRPPLQPYSGPEGTPVWLDWKPSQPERSMWVPAEEQSGEGNPGAWPSPSQLLTRSKDTLMFRYSSQMLDSILTQARTDEFYSVLGVPNSIQGDLGIKVLHLWMACQRMYGDKFPNAYVNHVFDRLWSHLDMMLVAVPGMSSWVLSKQLKALQLQTDGFLRALDISLEYAWRTGDHNYLLTTLWRNVFRGDKEMASNVERRVNVVHLRNYTLRGIDHIFRMDATQFYCGRVAWAPLFAQPLAPNPRSVPLATPAADADPLSGANTSPMKLKLSREAGKNLVYAMDPLPRWLPPRPTALELREAQQLDFAQYPTLLTDKTPVKLTKSPRQSSG